MKKITNILTYPFLLLVILLSCSEPENQTADVDLLNQESVSKLEAVIEEYIQAEKDLVKQHYNKLNTENKNQISLDDYQKNLKQKFRNYSTKALAGLEGSDHRIEPTLQVEEIKQSAKISAEMPEWYWNFQQNWQEKIIAAAE